MAQYYVDTTSTGTGDGTTTATTGVHAAFKTIAEVNAKAFTDGDVCSFNRGQTWREQLIPVSGTSVGITYNAYGTGNKPLLLGSITKNLTSDWTNISGNLWTSVQTTSFSDNFNDNSIDTTKWTTSVSGGGSVAETNNELELTTSTGGVTSATLQSLNRYDLTGSQITIKIVDSGNQALGNYELFAIDLIDQWSGALEYRIGGGNLKASVNSSVKNTIAYNATNHRYLRIREAGGTVYWDYSADNINFTNQYSAAVGGFDLTSAQINITALTWGAEASATTGKVDELTSTMVTNIDVGNIIFNNEASCGVKKQAAVSLTSQGDFWYDYTNKVVKVYSVGNPATFYSNIELAILDPIVNMQNKSYIDLQNLDIRYASGIGVSPATADHITIENCNLSYIGGKDQLGNYSVRYGNAIQISGAVSNITVKNCRIDNVYDSAINPYSASAITASNIYMYNNIITNSEYSYEVLYTNAGATLNGLYFENNTCKNAGSGWGHTQRWDSANARHFMLWQIPSATTNCYVRNNIFSGATESLVRVFSTTDFSKFTFDYNDLYQSSGHIGLINATNYDTLATWRTATSQEAHSISGDPLFVSGADFHLQISSGANKTGLTIATVTTDYDGVARPHGSAYSMGAYEGGEPFISSFSDSITSSDSRKENTIRILLDSITSTDAKKEAVTRILIESLSSSDSKIAGITRKLLDSINPLDSESFNLARTLIDSLNSSDNKKEDITRFLSDNQTTLDSLFRSISRELVDSLIINDFFETADGKYFIDTLSLSDSIIKEIAHQFIYNSKKFKVRTYLGNYIEFGSVSNETKIVIG